MRCSKVEEDERSVNADETKVDCRLPNPLHKNSKVSFFSVVHCHKRWNEWVPEANLRYSSVACVELDLTISLQNESYRLIPTRPWRLKTVASFIFDPLHAKAPTSKSVARENSRDFATRSMISSWNDVWDNGCGNSILMTFLHPDLGG